MLNTAGKSPDLKEVADALGGGARVVSVGGLSSIASKAFVLSRLSETVQKTFVVLTGQAPDIDTWAEDLRFWLASSVQDGDVGAKGPISAEENEGTVVPFPSFESDVYSGVSPHAETQEKRALAFGSLLHNDPRFVIASPKSLITRTPVQEEFGSLEVRLVKGGSVPPEDLVGKLLATGYRREDPITNAGEFSVRGGILDLWSPDSDLPVRIEYFGDSIESIRTFDPDSQLSISKSDSALVSPMREFSLDRDDLKAWADAAMKRFSDEKFSRNLRDRVQFASEGESFGGWEFLLPLLRPRKGSLFDYLEDFVLVVDEPVVVEQVLADFYPAVRAHLAETLEHGDIGVEVEELFLSGEELRERVHSSEILELRTLGRTDAATDDEFSLVLSDPGLLEKAVETAPSGNKSDPLFLFPAAEDAVECEIQSRSATRFGGELKRLARDLGSAGRSLSGDKETAFLRFVFRTAGMAERFSDILRDFDFVLPHQLVRLGELSAGFEIPSLGVTVYSESELFGETRTGPGLRTGRKRRRKRPATSAFVSDFRDLKSGDFVVHVDHGIGRFDGLQTIGTQGGDREFILLVYADDAKLFVPVERLDLVSRYSSGESTSPKIDRLGGLGWQKTKARAKRAMRDMADELLRLYAERKLVTGFAFSKDAPWQTEFEDAFPYRLTPDQKTSISELKMDMETPSPMDRLIVGDVGYGKTEVGMRAAFKAVMDGTQVAVLAPTTVLAYQHFETFRERFSSFPVKIDLLSRFRSRKEQKAAVEAAEKGETDILIGTHRLLSGDVRFSKLGLLIVDEEQRFGVAHKERLKQMRKKVDVLTLSATPIPRTLNMSLMGLRDMSIIETPPRDRLSINTQVVQFSEGVIRSAIELELARNGQSFFIHNRVETIDSMAAHIKRLVPHARLAVGHGQMSEKALEKVMLAFVNYEYDILVATTIIENGIDIPRANTMIINRADNYGLSQLYQLRGRVGRSNRRAYAYLLIPSELELTPIAKRRLSSIREFSDLGAGFRIAALDLELRGAGNVLGGQQSGHMDALGFDLYTKMLNRTIQELRGEDIEDEAGVSLNLGIDVSIPTGYINDTSQRLRTYKRIASADSEEALRRVYLEIRDRYGRPGTSVEALFEYARLRQKAEKMHIVSVDRSGDSVAIKLTQNSIVDPELLAQFAGSGKGRSFSPAGILRFDIPSDANPIDEARRVLGDIAGR